MSGGDGFEHYLGRRAVLRAVGAGAVAGLAGCGGGPSDGATERETDSADPETAPTDGTETTAETTTEQVDPGTEQWVFDPDGVDAFRSSPTVVDGTVYIGRQTGEVFALSAADGTEQWRFDAGEPVGSSPAVADGTVYVKRNEFDRVYAVDAADGTEEWRVSIDGQSARTSLSSPTVDGATVYVVAGGSVYALSAASGTEEWRVDTDGAAVSSVTVADDTVYTTSYPGNTRSPSGTVYALSASDGTERWQFGANTRLAPVTVADDTVYVGSEDDAVYALDPENSAELWSRDIDHWASTPTVADDTVYVGTAFGLDDGYVYAFDAADGTQQWRFEPDAAVSASPTVAGERVYFGDSRGSLYSVGTDGTEQWQVEAGGYSSPTVVDGTVYSGYEGGRVHAYAAATGESSRGSRVRLETLGYHDAGYSTD